MGFTNRTLPRAYECVHMPRERGDSGRFVESASHEDVLRVFEAVDGPVVTSADVADALSLSTESARRKLNDLEEKGHVESRKTAGRVVYWRVSPSSTPDYLKSFGKYSGTNIAETVERVGERFDHDIRERTDESA